MYVQKYVCVDRGMGTIRVRTGAADVKTCVVCGMCEREECRRIDPAATAEKHRA